MTPQQKLKRAVILRGIELGDVERPAEEITAENVDSLFDELDEDYALQDAKNEVRSSGTKTNLECRWSRHYESDAVAARMPDGSWIGWTYWYGGGKHGEPGEMNWIEDAYEVDCREEEKLIVVKTFSVKTEGGAA
jgi:hypothetical protein